MASKLAIGSALLTGVASHTLFFSRGEHHMYGTLYLEVGLTMITVATFVLHIPGSLNLEESLKTVLLTGLAYLAGLYSSLIIYRGSLHPLRKFPGPIGARFSSLWFSLQLSANDSHKKITKFHDRYGDFVRIGSSDLSITHPKAVSIIYGQGTRCTKADWYDLTQPMVSMQTTRNRVVHDQRRRIWSTAFSDKALRGYDGRIEYYRQQFLRQVAAYGGKPINATKWFNLFSFDVMGDLAFGTSFHMLETKQEHWAISLLNSGLEPLAWMLPAWTFRIAIAIPWLARGWWRFIKYCNDRLDDRIAVKASTPDIMTSLLGSTQNEKPQGASLKMLQGDSQLIIVAGSDTTAATLTALFYELCKNPENISILREEFAPFMAADGTFDQQKLQRLDHLNGVINETLRLHPPVPVALQRLTPPEGIMIGETFVPGNTTVYCPQYVLGHSENCYKHALDFVPERWYSRSDMILEKEVFAPFSMGTYGCIGRPLALLNVRMMVAKILMRFDVSFPLGDDGSSMEAGAKVHFTTSYGPLNLIFTEREF